MLEPSCTCSERTFASALALVLYAIAVNANVAAGWALLLLFGLNALG